MDNILFQTACDKIIHRDRERNRIGTLGEKTLHAVLKNYFEPDESRHEIRIKGYYADAVNENGIIEIQTRNFNALRNKLRVFLELEQVTVVYPIPYTKWLYWMDEENNVVTRKRKSPKKGTPYMAFYELYKIKEFLHHPNLSFCIILINMEEYKLLNGWSENKKRGSTRYDRIPTEVVEEIYIQNEMDFAQLIPEELEAEFTSKDYKMKTGLSISSAQTALNVLTYVGAVERVGKKGNAYIYTRAEKEI
jgi:hypothetical protein